MLILAAAVAGAAAGAFLSTPAYRLSVPVGYRAGCEHCHRGLPWLALPDRCAGCRTRMGPPAWALAVLGGLVCAGFAWGLGPQLELVPLLFLGLLGVLLGAIDLAAERLPDVLVLPGLAAAVAVLGGIAALTGAWGSWGRALAAGLAYAATYLLLALLPGGQLGLGDVKLAALLGVCLGWFGWPVVVFAILLPWLVNAPVAVVLLVRRGGGSMPFGPAMLAGAYLSLVPGLPLLYR
jgi:leader peptidase (prepilin peptidase) / N-methyltransferase